MNRLFAALATVGVLCSASLAWAADVKYDYEAGGLNDAAAPNAWPSEITPTAAREWAFVGTSAAAPIAVTGSATTLP